VQLDIILHQSGLVTMKILGCGQNKTKMGIMYKKDRKIWVNKSRLFSDAEKFDTSYYLGMSKAERLETVQFLRESYQKIKPDKRNESREGLRRVIRVIQ